MPHGPSNRMRGVQMPIIPVVAQWIRENPGTISLGQGVVSYGPPPQSLARVEDFFAAADNHKYQPVQGLPELVEAIRQKLRRENGLDVPAARIFVTAGANMGFLNALLAIADPGDEVILQVPYYFNHEMAITMASARPVLVPTTADYQLDLPAIARAITPRTKAIVTISPNNPTGAVYREADLRAVNQLCQDRGLYHIHDEAYEYFLWNGANHFSPGSLGGAHTISLFSLSKAYGFASWRIGWMVIPEELAEAVRKIQDTNLICAPVISQFAALGALAAGQPYARAQFGPLQQNRELFLQLFSDLREFIEVPEANGAFYFLARARNTQLRSLDLARKLIDHGVAVIPGSAFGLENGCFFRISYGALSDANAGPAIERLRRGLPAILS